MSEKPKIILSSLDVERLEMLLDALPRGTIPGQAELRAELDWGDIEWPRPGGGQMKLPVKEVPWQPERAGEFHR